MSIKTLFSYIPDFLFLSLLKSKDSNSINIMLTSKTGSSFDFYNSNDLGCLILQTDFELIYLKMPSLVSFTAEHKAF